MISSIRRSFRWGVPFLWTLFLSAFLFGEEPVSTPRAEWSASEFGAVPDGVTDVTEALQTALDTAGKAGGGTVTLTAGRYSVRGNLVIPAGVTLEGTYRGAVTIGNKDQVPDGTILLAYAGRGSQEGEPFIQLGGCNSVLKGVAVIYPEWDRKDVPPVPYPPCVFSTNTDNVAVIDCCLLNPYEGIRFVRAARHLVRNVTGYPIWRGLFVDQCYDIGHIENIHFWPFGLAYNPKDPYCEWINVHGVAFELARTDWHYVSNTFCFGYGVGYKFSDHGSGATNGNFLGLGADSCRRAVLVEAVQMPGLLITNGEFVGRWTSEDSICVEITEDAMGKVSLVNCSFWGPIDTCVVMKGKDGQFTADACHFCDWDNGNRNSPAIHLVAGKAIVSSSTFKREGIDVKVDKGVRNAILTGNQAPCGFRYEKEISRNVIASANEEPPLAMEKEGVVHYRFLIGTTGDAPYLTRMFPSEKIKDGPTFRWGTDGSTLTLPVIPGKRTEVTLSVDVPKEAIADPAGKQGFYLGTEKTPETLLTPLKEPGKNELTLTIPPQEGESVVISVHCDRWRPTEVLPNSIDERSLGIQFFGVEVKSEGATERVFDLQVNDWR